MEDNVDLPLHKMHVLLLRSNNPVKRIRPNLVSTAEAWIPEKQYHEFATLARPACLARVLRGQLTKFTRNNPGDSQCQCKLKPQRISPARTDLSLITDSHSDSQIPPVLETRKFTSFPSWPPLCTPKTSARPPPTFPASPREGPSCSLR